MDKTLQPRYAIETETYKYASILRAYNKWYIVRLTFKKGAKHPYEMDIKDKLVLNGINWEAADEIEYKTIGAFQNSNSNTARYYII